MQGKYEEISSRIRWEWAMRTRSHKPHATILLATSITAIVALAAAAFAAPTFAATAPASCAKLAKRIANGRATTSAVRDRQRNAFRHCLENYRRSTSKRRPPSAPSTPSDTAAPTVAWQEPSAGATLNGTLDESNCTATAADAVGVDRVVFKVDGTTLNTERVAPYNCLLDTTKVADGTHSLTATAFDAAGNSNSATISVKVSNKSSQPAPAPAPAPEPEPAPAPPPSSGDTAAPNVGWEEPAAGATVTGKLNESNCAAKASDAAGIDRVVFKVDGTTLNTERVAPYNCILDTTKVADGTHSLTATAFDAAGNSSDSTTSIKVANAVQPPVPAPEPEPAPAPPPSSSGGSLTIGIDGGYAGWSSTETTYRTQLNAAVTRHEWDPAQPVYAQDALVLKAASTVHTRIHALLGGNQLGDANHYREWVVAFIRRYGLGGSFWQEHPELDEARYAMRAFELGNEPYFGEMSASLYADTVRPTLEEVKRLGLPAEIVLPSRVYGTDTSWMDTLYQRIPNLNQLFYAFADHPYWYGHDPAAGTAAGPFGRISVLRKRMNEKGASSKPIFITEYGESTANCGSECVSEAVQAEHLSAMLNAAISRTEWKVEMVSVFQLLDRGTASTDRELQFGLLREDGTRKPAYPVVSELMQLYR